MSNHKDSWERLGHPAVQNVIYFIVACAAILSGWLAYLASSKAEFRNMKTKQLLGALQGQELYTDGGTYTYLDAVHTFSHDPHVYPFNWKSLKLLHRNVLIPIEVYGSGRSAELAEKLYSTAEVATLLTIGAIDFGGRLNSEEIRKCFGRYAFLDPIANSGPENAPCFQSDEKKFKAIKSAAIATISSLKCYGRALEGSVMQDLGGSSQIESCESPPLIVRRLRSGEAEVVITGQKVD